MLKKNIKDNVNNSNQKKLKVCVIYPTIFPTIGGYEELAYDLIACLSKTVSIQVVCTGIRSQEAIPSNIEVFPILKPLKATIINLIIFYNFLRMENPDIIHAHLVFPSGFIAIPASLFGIPVVCTSHGSDIQLDNKIGYGYRRNKFISMIVKFTLNFLSLHVVLSKSMIKDAILAGSNLSKIRVIYNGIDLSKIPLSEKTNIKCKLGISKDDFIVLYLGRLHPKKCPLDLIKAFAEITDKIPNAKLIITGKGDEEGKIRNLVSVLSLNNKVIITGFVSNDEKWDLLRRCNVFVLPSAIEGHPITLIEAMACGKPSITTNVGPFPELIIDGKSGLLVPLHSPQKLAEAIMKLALNEDLREEIGRIARREVEERFDINKISINYLEIYSNSQNIPE